jgi:hypothetical protein
MLGNMKENATLSNIDGMGEILLPTQNQNGSGDVPAGHGDAKKEYKKKKKKMAKLKSFQAFTESTITEGTFNKKNTVKAVDSDGVEIESFNESKLSEESFKAEYEFLIIKEGKQVDGFESWKDAKNFVAENAEYNVSDIQSSQWYNDHKNESIVSEAAATKNQVSKAYNSSEDIKSTLNGLSYVLKKETLDESDSDYLDMVKSNLEDTLKLINKIQK